MTMVRARPPHGRLVPGAALCAAAMLTALLLAGCAGTYREEPKASIALDGQWKLNPAESDDPKIIIDKMRAKAWKILRRSMPPPPQDQPVMAQGNNPGSKAPPGGAAAQQPSLSPNDMQAAEDEYYARKNFHGDPLKGMPVMNDLQETLSRGDFLTVKQTADEIVFDYGATTRSFTPGGHSVVSSDGGVADQKTGWQGKEYVIDIRPQLGPKKVERYGLSEDGKHLVMKLYIDGGELPSVDLTRVYDRTSEIAPKSTPTND